MKTRSTKLLLIFAFLIGIAHVASAATIDKAALIGKWDYMSYTLLQKGNPSGTVQFKPGTMSFTYRQDGTWEMEAHDATNTRLNGRYEIHSNEVIMKKSDGSLYQDFDVELKNDGKIIVFRDKRSIITASKMEIAP